MEPILQGYPMTVPLPPRLRSRFRAVLRQAGQYGLLLALLPMPGASGPVHSSVQAAGISRAAADSCEAKIERLESFAAESGRVATQRTRLDEIELNSYLELVLRPEYHPSLESIRLKFLEGRLQCAARINLDLVELSDTRLWSGLIRSMLSGIHDLTVLGKLDAKEGKASFVLEEARFDGIMLPNLLVTEIISAVGRKQTPPIDPMQPSEMPFRIRKVDVLPGHILIYQ